MYEENDYDNAETDAAPEAPPIEEEPKIMCYVSKVMVPLSQTVEVEYEHGKTFRVQSRYVKFEQAEA